MIVVPLATATIVMCGVLVPTYALMQGIEFMYDTARNKQQPITVIKFKEWSEGK